MRERLKYDGDPLSLALGMMFWAAAFYVVLAPPRRFAVDPSIPTWQLFYPFIGALFGLAIDGTYRLIGKRPHGPLQTVKHERRT